MKKVWAAVLPAMVAVMASCAVTRSNILKEAFVDELRGTERLIQTGHYRQAVDELSMLLAMDPDNEQILMLRGIAYQKWEKYPEAIRDYEAVLQTNSASLKAHFNLGMIFAYQQSDPRRALEHFDRFLTIAPEHGQAFTVAKVMATQDSSNTHEVMSDPYLQQLMDDAAASRDSRRKKELLQEGTKLQPDSPLFFYLLGQACEAEGDNKAAIQYYQEALARRPTCARCHQSLGNLLIQGSEEKKGRIHLLKAKLFDPGASLYGP